MAKIYKTWRFIWANWIWANSTTLYDGEFVSKVGWYIVKTTPWVDIEWIKAWEQTFASNNQTLDKFKAEYVEKDEYTEFDVNAVWATVVFAWDLITDNTINMDVNWVAITQVTFTTDHATTMWLIATELETFAEIASVTVWWTWNRTLYITPANTDTLLIDSIVVAAWVSQTTWTFSELSITVADEWKYYDITTWTQYADINTESASTWQLKLVKALNTKRWVFNVVNL